MKQCSLCRTKKVQCLLAFKHQPVSNRFLQEPQAPQYRHDLAVGQCASCGLVQLLDPVPAGELMPPYEWITYSEPEGHLDQLAGMLSALPGLTPQAIVAGISFKDDSILRRLREKGFVNSWRLSPEVDLGIGEKKAGIETLQDRLTPERSEIISSHHGRADLLILRHVWEHSFQPRRLMLALRKLLKPEGYLVLEVPDCSRTLAEGDYTTLWEEHNLYFTPPTFKAGLSWVGLEPVRLESFAAAVEISLVAIGRFRARTRGEFPEPETLKEEILRAETFAGDFPKTRERIHNLLSEHRAQGGRIAIFGAGHLAAAFLNFLELKALVECVVDDHPRKKGLFMPGSALPICGSEELLKRKITLCLLSVNLESEEKVIARNQAFVQQGGRFASIFPASQRALK